jgi:uncharacterized protein YbbC (DUF1343 family)
MFPVLGRDLWGFAGIGRNLILPLLLGWFACLPAAAQELRGEMLTGIGDVVRREIAAHHIPGAVVLVGQGDKVIYREAFGWRSLEPEQQPMTVDTVFDLASLTKAVATAPAVMQLVEAGKLSLDEPVARYWPEFASQGKDAITVRHLLTHVSGLRAGLEVGGAWSGSEAALALAAAEPLRDQPGRRFLYSDINYIVLGELVRRASGEPLDRYAARHLFQPLGMTDTEFQPARTKRQRIAPTDRQNGRLRWGEVQDPVAARMGGVAGHFGLFSTADDLARFARMVLNGGRLGRAEILKPQTVAEMARAQGDPQARRGLGWDSGSPVTPHIRDGSFGHVGFTGTSLWLDVPSNVYVVVLTSRLHPDSQGDVKPLRTEIAAIVARALVPPVKTGLDVLEESHFAALHGRNVGLIVNHTAVDARGVHAAALLRAAPGVHLKALFSPEHGLYGTVDEKVASGVDPVTGLPVYSLYGEVRRPTDAMLAGLDTLVFDMQDAGVRFYTYASTMGYAMEAAARRGIRIVVLDRPNPIDASVVQGPMLDPSRTSFTGYFPMPIRHGMTLGELARMFNAEAGINADLQVIAMQGYQRASWYDATGLAWRPPSPNLRTMTAVALYPGVALVEGANVSVGRGTSQPFELVGAPWIDGEALAVRLSQRGLAGVRIVPATFTPHADRYKGQRCHGVRVDLTDRNALDSARLGVELVAALWRLHPDTFKIGATLGMIGSAAALEAIKAGTDPAEIAAAWQPALDRFKTMRAKYLLY